MMPVAPMEVVFANHQLARSDKWNVYMAMGRLSLSKGEGEDEGLFRATWKRVSFKPLTLVLSPCQKGRGDKRREMRGGVGNRDVRVTN